jgi:HK97 family phage prohead protease
VPEPYADAPRDNLVRSAPFELVRADGDDGLTLSGYGAVFDQPTVIDSWEGRFEERLAPGSFRKTLAENGSRVRLQFDHGQHPLIGSMPIGRINSLREDDKGLFVEARLSDNWLVQPVRDAIREGSIDGMSFRFTVTKEKWSDMDSDMPKRSIQEVKLMEVGPVVWPAYDGTSVGVRSRDLAKEALEANEGERRELARIIACGVREITPPLVESPLSVIAETRTSEEAAPEGTSEEAATTEVTPGAEVLTPDTYTPAQRAPMSRERRQSQLGFVRALVAQTNRRDEDGTDLQPGEESPQGHSGRDRAA